ncbi:MAG TPA: large conductance mechanosensitive channel protein MscL [Candidatus Saccharimonadales bacterium]|nr:large conductance mechanosensitive channel protein MscL [Candidatus Saccharimonadales bacterium]
MLKDFKKFVLRGNVVDLAVAVVVGAAFNSVVQGLVKDIIQPLINGITGSTNGQAVQGTATWDVGGHTFTFPWGDFVSAVISFLIIAAVVFFLVVQPLNQLQTKAGLKKGTEEPSTKKCPECLSEIPKKATRCAFCGVKQPSK